jgi:hypothetical protein
MERCINEDRTSSYQLGYERVDSNQDFDTSATLHDLWYERMRCLASSGISLNGKRERDVVIGLVTNWSHTLDLFIP